MREGHDDGCTLTGGFDTQNDQARAILAPFLVADEMLMVPQYASFMTSPGSGSGMAWWQLLGLQHFVERLLATAWILSVASSAVAKLRRWALSLYSPKLRENSDAATGSTLVFWSLMGASPHQ